jgi:NADPH:quinone reductase-like Zn-dependent oxidoreductase
MVAMAAAAARTEQATMRAIVRSRWGSPDVLELREAPRPELTDDRVLVRVRASSVNKSDWHSLTGTPLLARPMLGGILKPKTPLLGTDFAGVVEAVGKDVTDAKPGDEVFGGRDGAYAEYVSAINYVPKPANLTFEEAAAVPIAGLTALQGLRDHAHVQSGQKVLINGASGGVGTFAVQIAKALGAHVTAVCSSRNVELVRALGADRVIDYTKEDFTLGSERYDAMLDITGSKSLRRCKRVLNPGAPIVVIGGHASRGPLGPLGHLAGAWLTSRLGGPKATFFVAKVNKADLEALRELLESGKVKPAIEKRYTLSETAEAMRYFGEGHVQSKLVITI